MSYQYPLQQIRQPRSYIYSSNVDALTLQSIFPETRLTFFTSKSTDAAYGRPNFMLSASNELFNVIKNDTVISSFNLSNGVPELSVYGNLRASNVIVSSPLPRKGVILSDYNPVSQHVFAGVGYDGSTLNYQVPTRNAVHAFYGAASPVSSVEWMRIQESSNHTAQVGIGTNAFAGSEALRVAGDTVVTGRLTATGGITGTIDQSSLPPTVPSTDQYGRLSSNQLPNAIVYTNPQTNLISSSLLPYDYKFQTLVSNKNVGIGTRVALQKLHIQGNVYTTDRLGVGISSPVSRVHALESSSSIPVMILDNTAGGDLLQGCINGQTSYIMSGSRAALGIGTTAVPLDRSLHVQGNAVVTGSITCSNMNMLGSNITLKGINIQSSSSIYLRNETVIQDAQNSMTVVGNVMSAYTPFMFNAGVSVDEIRPLKSGNVVTVKESSLSVEQDIFMRGTIVSLSDMRIKEDIVVIDRPLDRIEYLHGYTYRRKDIPSEKRYAGVLAQEVMDSLPEAAAKIPGDDNIGVQYTSIIPLLIEAIRELKGKVAKLEANVI